MYKDKEQKELFQIDIMNNLGFFYLVDSEINLERLNNIDSEGDLLYIALTSLQKGIMHS